jgi:hypothetical protein
LLRLAKIVHAADIAEQLDSDPIARGWSDRCRILAAHPEDEENLVHQFEVYDALYAWCRLQVPMRILRWSESQNINGHPSLTSSFSGVF